MTSGLSTGGLACGVVAVVREVVARRLPIMLERVGEEMTTEPNRQHLILRSPEIDAADTPRTASCRDMANSPNPTSAAAAHCYPSLPLALSFTTFDGGGSVQ